MEKALKPPVDATQLPPLYEISWPKFEALTVDLLQYEDGITVSDLHAPSGATDYGADVIAWRRDRQGIEVASCKRYTSVTPSDIVKWSDEFLKHWEGYWAERSVRRFVLAVTAPNVTATKTMKQFEKERARFAELGVDYEFWGLRQFVHRLRPRRQLTAAYPTEPWADIICGPVQVVAGAVTQPASVLNEAVISHLSDLQAQLSGHAAARAWDAIDALRAGRLDAVRALIAELREEKLWGQLTPQVQAQVARLAGSLALQDGDIDRARKMAAEARTLSPTDEPRLEARIALETDGPAAGLASLGVPVSIAGRQLHAALLLGDDQPDAAETALAALMQDAPEDPETLRLLALAHLRQGRRDEALAVIGQAEILAGHWIAIMRAAAAIRYSQALSPALGPAFVMAPNPFSETLLRKDKVARAHLEAALVQLEKIALLSAEIEEDPILKLAILASLDGRKAEASSFARGLLEENPAHTGVAAWVLQRELDVDLSATRGILERHYESGTDVATVRVLGFMIAAEGDLGSGIAFLEAHVDRQAGEAATEARDWIGRLGDNPLDADSQALIVAQRTGNWEDALRILERALGTACPEPFGLTVAEYAASAGRYDLLAPFEKSLIAYGTPTGVHLAILTAAASGRYQRVLDILAEHEAIFADALPNDVRRLKVEALANTVGMDRALSEAKALSVATGSLHDQLLEQELRAHIGGVSQAVPVIRKALAEGALNPRGALQWSHRLQQIDLDLSKRLLRTAIDKGICDDHALAAWNQAAQLGLEDIQSALMPRIMRRAESGADDVRMFSYEEARTYLDGQQQTEAILTQNYMDGAIPVHLLLRSTPEQLLRISHGNMPGSSLDPRLAPRLLRHGARPRAVLYERPWLEWKIHLDVTGLLEAERFGLLSILERHPTPIMISPHLPVLLFEMASGLNRPHPQQIEAMRRVVKLHDDGIVAPAYFPGTIAQTIGLNENDGGTSHRLADLVATLSGAGRLEIARLHALLGEGAGNGLGPHAALDLGQPILMSISALDRMISAGVAEAIAATCALVVAHESIEDCRAAIAGLDADMRLSGIAHDLRQRLADGIESGLYRLMPMIQQPDQDDSLLGRQLSDMLSITNCDDGVVWFDDRNLTGYVNAGTCSVVGTIDVVHALARASEISAEESEDLLARIRASGVTAFPFDAEEVAGPLLAAPISSIGLIETQELMAIRRSFAMSLLTKVQGELAKLGISAQIAQRRDSFASVPFQWLHSSLQVANRRSDAREFAAFVESGNALLDMELDAEELIAIALSGHGDFLRAWVAEARPLEPFAKGAVGVLQLDLVEHNDFRKFVRSLTDLFAEPEWALEETQPSFEEDQRAWKDLFSDISGQVGRQAPLDTFLQELDLRSKEPPIKAGVVPLLTIHGSKGNEFPHVYLLGLAEDVLPSFQSKKAGDRSPQMEEERRNCFVAITRCMETLTLSRADKYNGWAKTPSRFLVEMGMIQFSR